MPAASSLPGSVSPARYRVIAPVRKLRAYDPSMALSLAFMVFYVPIYFSFDSVERVCDDAVILSVFFKKFVNECNNNSEPASNESNDHAFSHVITVPGGTGFRL